jgi:hypothetical protein
MEPGNDKLLVNGIAYDLENACFNDEGNRFVLSVGVGMPVPPPTSSQLPTVPNGGILGFPNAPLGRTTVRADGSTAASVYLDRTGQARWYKSLVAPDY